MSTTAAVVSAVSACLQTAIVVVAAYYALRQIREARNARTATVFIALNAELESVESRRNRGIIFRSLPDGDLTSRPLSQSLIDTAAKVVSQYTFVASLTSMGVIDVDSVAATHGRVIERLWRRLYPFVLRQRALFGANHGEAFEALAEVCIRYNKEKYGTEFLPVRFPEESSEEKPTTQDLSSLLGAFMADSPVTRRLRRLRSRPAAPRP